MATTIRPTDCTCDGAHSDSVALTPVQLANLIDLEVMFGGCRAEIRALRRIEASL